MYSYFLSVLSAHGIHYLFIGIKVIHDFLKKFLNVKKNLVALGLHVIETQPLN